MRGRKLKCDVSFQGAFKRKGVKQTRVSQGLGEYHSFHLTTPPVAKAVLRWNTRRLVNKKVLNSRKEVAISYLKELLGHCSVGIQKNRGQHQ